MNKLPLGNILTQKLRINSWIQGEHDNETINQPQECDPNQTKKPSFIDLTIDDDDHDDAGVSEVTGDTHEQRMSFFSSTNSEDDDNKQDLILFAVTNHSHEKES